MEMRDLVRNGYEGGQYEVSFRTSVNPNIFEKKMLDKVLVNSPEHMRVLDLGCGTGFPYDYYMVLHGVELIGVDFCWKHLKQAVQNVPTAHYILGDISNVGFLPKHFDLITSFYAIFHIPREEHKHVFKLIYSWLKTGGKMLATLGTTDLVYGDEEDWCGADRMAWSTYPPERYCDMLIEIGFSVVEGLYEGEPGDDEYHFWIVCEKN